VELKQVERLAKALMAKHGLTEWYFVWRRWKVTFGACDGVRQIIYLSGPLTRLNSEKEVKDTILREIAHALAGCGEGHGAKWKRTARRIGAVPKRCCGSEVTRPKTRWIGTCPSCRYQTERYRRGKQVACQYCCDGHNGGRYTDKYLMRWTRQR
jgi:hypothetical protein